MPLALLFCALFACAPKVPIEIFRAAQISLPEDIQTLAVIDRSRAKPALQELMGDVEGALSGRPEGADRHGAERTVHGLVETLEDSKRFHVVTPLVGKKYVDTRVFQGEPNWAAFEELCQKSGADAIVSLEDFDSESHVRDWPQVLEAVDLYGQATTVTLHQAQRTTAVKADWRIYNPSKKTVLDAVGDWWLEQSWDDADSTQDAARRRLPPIYDTVLSLGHEAGRTYGHRISPKAQTVRRAFFASGDSGLRQAAQHAQKGQWDKATTLWRKLEQEHEDVTIKGMAQFNLAVAFEVNGNLQAALLWIGRAKSNLNSKRSQNYATELQRRNLQRTILPRSTR